MNLQIYKMRDLFIIFILQNILKVNDLTKFQSYLNPSAPWSDIYCYATENF